MRMIAKWITRWTSGKVRFQRFYEKLFGISLEGMNYGSSEDIKISGELGVLHFFAKEMNPVEKPVVFDVGANVGKYALEVLAKIPNCDLYCFEPSPKAVQMLKQNLAGYNVHVLEFGLHDEDAKVSLYANEAGSSISSIYPRELNYRNIRMLPQEEITLKRLQSFCEEEKIGHIHLLKIDVEGNEYHVLNGCREMLNQRKIDIIQFEFGGCAIDSKLFFRDLYFLLDPEYYLFRIVRDGFYPLMKYTEHLELFIKSDFLAVSRNFPFELVRSFRWS